MAKNVNPVKVEELFKTETVEVEGEFEGESYQMTVCIYPTPQTPYFLRLAERAQTESDFDAYVELLTLLIPGWSVQVDGKPIPPTKESFLHIPRDFADHLF